MNIRYCAYGSNMCSARLRRRVPNFAVVGRAVLADHELRFRKRSRDGSSKCDVVPAVGRVVHGVVFDVPWREKSSLDAAEGLGQGYREICCSVTTAEGLAIEAFMYVAEPNAVDESLVPYSWYKRIVVAGACEHGVATSYIAWLEEAPCHDDPDVKRASCQLGGAGLRA